MDVAEQIPEDTLPHKDKTQLVLAKKTRPHAFDLHPFDDSSQERLFISEMGERIMRLRHVPLTKRELAFEVIDFVERLVRFETKLYSVRFGIDIFLEKLHASSAISQILQQLYRWARLQVRGLEDPDHKLIISESLIIGHLEDLLHWYSVRSVSLYKLSSHLLGDSVFPLHIIHDRERVGVVGFEIQTGLALFGRAFEQLWLKVFLKEGDRYIGTRKGWESWVDDNDLFARSSQEEAAPFAALLPVVPQGQRLIVDKLELFIPYAALDLSAGKQEVTIEAILFDEKGEKVAAAEAQDLLNMPVYGSGARKILSNQALGMWPADVVRGDAIRDLKVRAGVMPLAHNAVEVVKVSFDLTLFDHQNDKVVVELRFLSEGGDIIESRGDGEGRHDYVLRHEIFVSDVLSDLTAVELCVPLNDLNWEDVEYGCMAEVSILGKQDKVLCGAVAAFDLPEHFRSQPELLGDDEERSLARPRRQKLIVSQDRAISVDVTPQWQTPRGTAMRFAVYINDNSILERRGSVVLSLRDEKEKPLLAANTPSPVMRAQRLPVARPIDGPEAVFLVHHDDVFSEGEVSLYDREVSWGIAVRGVDDVVMGERFGQVAVGYKPSKLPLPARGEPNIFIEDVEPSDVRHFPPLRFRVYINFNRLAYESSQYMLLADLTPSAGNLKNGDHEPTGMVIPCDISPVFDGEGHHSDRFQTVHVIDCTDIAREKGLPPGDAVLKVKLYAANGSLIDSYARPLSPEKSEDGTGMIKRGIRRLFG
ncbi:MAG: hypothetical protein J5J00_16105 [Deltaproteobacteria bacterium]|nr:hypothetical protein [Deltaproteobacteria bacterium]